MTLHIPDPGHHPRPRWPHARQRRVTSGDLRCSTGAAGAPRGHKYYNRSKTS